MKKIINYVIIVVFLMGISVGFVYGNGDEDTTSGSQYNSYMDAYGDTQNDAKKNNAEGKTIYCYYQNDEKTFFTKGRLPNKGGSAGTILTVLYNNKKVNDVKIKNYCSNDECINGTGQYEVIDDVKVGPFYSAAGSDGAATCPTYLFVIEKNGKTDAFATNDSGEMQALNSLYEKYKTTSGLGTNVSKDSFAGTSNVFGGGLTSIDDNSSTCEDILGIEFLEILNKYYKIVYIIVPVLVIILGMLDFARATLNGKEDDMKKGQSRFIKRLLMGVAVFLIPTILNVLFFIVNVAKDTTDTKNYFNYIYGDTCIE